ncbi:MAG: hypothetical protein GX813_03020 [Erysipelotrichia bacterium]|nr:hypothetical protein [Erysipelotrichia bacterium]
MDINVENIAALVTEQPDAILKIVKTHLKKINGLDKKRKSDLKNIIKLTKESFLTNNIQKMTNNILLRPKISNEVRKLK